MADLDEIMRTTFACREFTADPISDADVAAVLDAARFASSGANRQAWRVVAVRSADTRAAIVELGLPAARRYVAEEALGGVGFSTIDSVRASADELSAPAVSGRCSRPWWPTPRLTSSGCSVFPPTLP